MSFVHYKTLSQVSQTFQLSYREQDFVEPKPLAINFTQPYFIVVEAKKDNFNEGWGQCAAELVAIQKLNNNIKQILFGIVTN